MPTAPWAPTLQDVGDYVTSRTVDAATPGDDTPLGTFTEDTYPTAEQVDRLIAGAASWVLNVTGPVVTDLEETARDVAAMRAAALVEMSYPVRDGDLDEVATLLLEQSRSARDELVIANRAGGSVGISPTAAPAFSFPDAAPWCGDQPAWRWR